MLTRTSIYRKYKSNRKRHYSSVIGEYDEYDYGAVPYGGIEHLNERNRILSLISVQF